MRATCWTGRNTVEVLNVPDPQILSARDAIVRITSSAICGSDLHLYDGYVPTMKTGDILGHEFMGEVVESAGRGNLEVGDRVVVPFPIACGACNMCAAGLFAAARTPTPTPAWREDVGPPRARDLRLLPPDGRATRAGQAEYARVPFADVGPLKIDDGFTDEQVLFLTDIFPTGYMGAEFCDIEPGDVIAVWGAGPVGLFAIASAFLLGR
jgi:threonine dehydrogenase-like Zn-dependent dehydrogenase